MAIPSSLTHLTDIAHNKPQTQSGKPHLSSVSYLTKTNTMSTTSSQDSSSSYSDSTTIEPVVSTPRRLYTCAGRAAAAVISTITSPFRQAERQNRLQTLLAAVKPPSSSSEKKRRRRKTDRKFERRRQRKTDRKRRGRKGRILRKRTPYW